jgi:hypothetical protein
MKKLIIFLALILLVTTSTAITVDGSKYIGNIAPGLSDVHHIGVSSDINDTPMNVTITTSAFGQNRDMSYTMLNYANKYSSGDIISIDKPNFILEPGQKITVNATISLPTGVGDGGRYAIIYVKASPTNQQSTYATAVMIPVFVTIDKSNITETVNVLGVTVNGTEVITRIKNTGDHHFYGLNNAILLFNTSTGAFVTQSQTKPSAYTFLPESDILSKLTLDRSVDNSYTIVAQVYRDDVKLFDSPVDFVETKVTPKPTPTSLSVSRTPLPVETMTQESSPTPTSAPKTPMSLLVVMVSLCVASIVLNRIRK